MYLKSITLKGFKSFPDRTRLDFGPGVSVIVGPNGSGKSNVTDAVLWALGEQSPLAVRGQSMQDVIFSGAPGRQGARDAEVELVLDDSEGSLGLGVPEVSIRRRLDRTGEGEYRLAGARCRLVDVLEVLSDTGLGREMHSVISQGRVEAIVTSKPRDRRLLIEEAAGLGKHRKRRRRAALKLTRTQDNLDRALDVEREARSRLRPLKRQAEAAEQHARLERQSLEARWELARDDVRAARSALLAAEQSAQRAHASREAVERELAGVAERRGAAEQALAERSAQREELSRRSFTARAARERLEDRAESASSAREQLERRVERSRATLGALAERGEDPASDPAADQRIAELEEALAALERDLEAELERELLALQQERQAAATLLSERADELGRAVAQREQVERSLDAARGELRSAERAVEAARREAARIGGELAGVNQFLRSQAGAPGGAAVLADELEVEPGYELAVAAALDGRLRAAVVPDRAAAAALLDRAGDYGGRALVSGAGASAADGAGGSRPAPGAELLSERVRGGASTVAVARALLRDTWLVESLERLDENFAGVAVTRSGRVWSARAGEVRQAPAVGEERVLAQRNRREQLIKESEAAAQAELDVAAVLGNATARAAEAERTLEDALGVQRRAGRARDEAAEQEQRLTAMIERRRAAPADGPGAARRLQVEAELAALSAERQRAARERSEREARIAAFKQAIARDGELLPALQALRNALIAAGDAISLQAQRFDADLAADREAGEHVAAELRTCAQQEAELHTRLHRENELLTETEVRLQRARDRAADVERELGELAARLELAAEPADTELAEHERQALTERLARLVRRREQLGPVNPLAEQEYAEAVEHVEELEHQRSDLETALRELEKLIADTDRQIRETFEQTFSAAAENFERVAAQLFPGGHGRLRLVAEREGFAPVLGGESAADGEDGAGEDDAGEDAEATVGEEPEEQLGVEIEITPGGKDTKRLTLLSGGEKSMTALAFLFAVFLARPCPFYILDEVEAALDDVNIDRFLELLRTYSKQAQFIVVTHQKRTMEAADSLYGVSMGGDGISKVISRRLPPAEQAA